MNHSIFDGTSHPVTIVKFVFPYTSLSWFPDVGRCVASDVTEKKWFWMEDGLEEAIEKMVHTWGRPVSMDAGFCRYLRNGDELYELLLTATETEEGRDFVVIGMRMPEAAKSAILQGEGERRESEAEDGVLKLLSSRPKEVETNQGLLDQRPWLAYAGELSGALKVFQSVNTLDIERGLAVTEKIQKVIKNIYEEEGLV